MATSASGEKSDHFILRLTDIVKEPLRFLQPIGGYEEMPLVSLEVAVAPLESFLPDIQTYACMTKQGWQESADGLSLDESAAIMLYTTVWEPFDECLYVALNAALRSGQRPLLKPWFLFLKLFLTAFNRLPYTSRCNVYRWTELDLQLQYTKGKPVIWWGFSSCTASIEAFESKRVLGKSGPKTLFAIECFSGKDIRKHSYNPSDDEILLCPGTYFEVVSCIDARADLHIIQLKETMPPFPLLAPVVRFESSFCAQAMAQPIICKQLIYNFASQVYF
ncbi:unnamed protein product [Rotaria socialis]|uniref:NAD(P)(+)--arginine ADP-ribosyltransferase n=1 Tax=Rotaria socialis TaxID=392032 RepID=A0A821H481_9BILA|nr:unnamed protein product [Rotaria socialis]CAF4458756.1 unnamed protein product [Rotaria socialis]CAF4681465.1 unnamed protein product [Rotaria socialis]